MYQFENQLLEMFLSLPWAMGYKNQLENSAYK
jgi:hypothetical protein